MLDSVKEKSDKIIDKYKEIREIEVWLYRGWRCESWDIKKEGDILICLE